MKYKIVGSWLILIGVISLFTTMYFFPPEGVPGSYTAPMTPMRFQSTQQMMSLATGTTEDTIREYYIETDSFTLATQTVEDEPITPMTFKQGTHYKYSYVFKKELSYSEVATLSASESVVGIWDVPVEVPSDFMTTTPTMPYKGDFSVAMEFSGAQDLIDMGYSGQNTIVAILDDFPPESYYYSVLPDSWADRVIHYPTKTNDDGDHGIMTSAIVAEVAPDCLLYFDDIYYDEDGDGYADVDIIQCYQDIIDLKSEYPGYQIVSSNSYTHNPQFGTAYTSPDHPVNRKALEMTEEGIAVVFGAGNWAHDGEHNSKWMFYAGYDSRNWMFSRDKEIGYPAVYDEIICVAGTTAYGDEIVSYSSLGRGVDGNTKPDVSAPTQFDYPKSPFYGGLACGTSASCPFMAGICADILSGKQFEADRLVGSIRAYSTDRGDSGFDEEFGFGHVDTVNIFNNYENWVKPLEESLDLSMYIMSISMLAIGVVVYNKDRLTKIVGG